MLEAGGWRLKGNWEDKIWFLEQVHILERDPSSLPKTWLDKWERKQRAQEEKKWWREVKVLFDQILKDLDWAEEYLPRGDRQPVYSLESEFFKERLKRILISLQTDCHTLRSKLPEIENRFFVGGQG